VLLRKARNVTYGWISELRKKLDSAQDETSCGSLQYRLCMLCMTCFSTFDVCLDYIPVILASDEDFSIAMQCAIIVHYNTPSPTTDDDEHYLARMLSRHSRLQHRLEPFFGQSFPPILDRAELLHSDGYDDALAQLWPGYCQGNSRWNALPSPNSRWISCVTQAGQEVHYDLLTGELLIGGKRLGGLPGDIVRHSTYNSLFGTVSDQIQLSRALSCDS
jgi:hypothetical protein